MGTDLALLMATILFWVWRKEINFWGHSCPIILITAEWEGRPCSPVLEFSMSSTRLMSNSVIALTHLALTFLWSRQLLAIIFYHIIPRPSHRVELTHLPDDEFIYSIVTSRAPS